MSIVDKVNKAIWDAGTSDLPPLESIELTPEEFTELRHEAVAHDWHFEVDFEGQWVSKYRGVVITQGT